MHRNVVPSPFQICQEMVRDMSAQNIVTVRFPLTRFEASVRGAIVFNLGASQ